MTEVFNAQRLKPVFSAEDFHSRGHRITLIGCGAIGSSVGMMLAEAGLSFTAIDPDLVSEENICNQEFELADIRKRKVVALQDRAFLKAGVTVTPVCEHFNGTQELGDIIFVAVDSMTARRTVWESCRLNIRRSLLIEARMGTDHGRVYTIDPCSPAQMNGYEAPDVLYGDDESVEHGQTACQQKISVGPTAKIMASMMVWQLYRWFAMQNGFADTLEQEIILYLRPMHVQTRRFR